MNMADELGETALMKAIRRSRAVAAALLRGAEGIRARHLLERVKLPKTNF